ncbi:MAG: hypothetical protein PHX70_03505 [Clostridium sp.]|nr:hypothetical protein [Clostridium sp.]
MRLLVVERKKIGVIFVLIGLMIFIFCIGLKLDNKMRSVAFIQSNLGALKEYNINEYKINYKLPDKWSTNIENFVGQGVVYHNNFQSNDGNINGFVQAWKYSGDLEKFINSNTSKLDKKSQNFKISGININDSEAYSVTYRMNYKNNTFNAFEYFIKEDDVFIRFAFYVKDKGMNVNTKSVLKAIVETINKE